MELEEVDDVVKTGGFSLAVYMVGGFPGNKSLMDFFNA